MIVNSCLRISIRLVHSIINSLCTDILKVSIIKTDREHKDSSSVFS